MDRTMKRTLLVFGFLILTAFIIWVMPASLVVTYNWVIRDVFPGLAVYGFVPLTITWTQGATLWLFAATLAVPGIFVSRVF